MGRRFFSKEHSQSASPRVTLRTRVAKGGTRRGARGCSALSRANRAARAVYASSSEWTGHNRVAQTHTPPHLTPFDVLMLSRMTGDAGLSWSVPLGRGQRHVRFVGERRDAARELGEEEVQPLVKACESGDSDTRLKTQQTLSAKIMTGESPVSFCCFRAHTKSSAVSAPASPV